MTEFNVCLMIRENVEYHVSNLDMIFLLLLLPYDDEWKGRGKREQSTGDQNTGADDDDAPLL